MHVVVAGSGRVGSALSRWLADDGHDVTVIDKNQAALDRLGKSFNGARLLGVAYDVDILRRTGLDRNDTFVAVTDSDNANLMAVEVAKSVFGVQRAIARLYDPNREEAYRALGIQHVTGTKLIANVFYEQVVDHEFAYHVTFTDGDVEIVEFVLNASAHGLGIDDLEVRNKLRVAAVRRGDHTFIPNRRFELHEGDLVVASAREGVKLRIEHYLKQLET
jgi:trk system potassium uptake protein